MQDALMWSFILLGLGLLLIVLECFVPSGGMLGVSAAVALLAAVVVGFLASPRIGSVILAVEAIAVPGMIAAAVHVWPHTPFGKRVLISHEEARKMGERPDVIQLQTMLGAVGVAEVDLLPSGIVRIHGVRYDATAMYGSVDEGEAVEVISADGGRLRVRKTSRKPEPEEKSAAEPTPVLEQSLESLGIDPFEDPLR
jgi:membrane-bound serine protease (ClpP class)